MPSTIAPSPNQLLHKYWGYAEFRPHQRAIIDTLIAQQDALVVMPTGGGKSICFQLPALVHPGLTIVVSPLVALMEDQVQALQQRGIAAAALHYQMIKGDRRKVLWQLENQRLKLLYVSPETLLSQPVWQRLCSPDLLISMLVLDEAHCLAQWGDSFRPAYLRLGAVRSALLEHKSVSEQINLAALTATANPDVQKLVCRELSLAQPQIFQTSPYRPNLHLSVQFVFTPQQRRQRLKQFIQSHKLTAGIVYVRTRDATEDLAQWLAADRYRVAAYHAGLSTPQRRTIERDWLNGKLQFVVCTNAFGMGLDKPDVRWVVHFHAPLDLGEYLQEIGRAGRDGTVAETLVLASEPTGWIDGSDRQRWHYFEQQQQKQQRQAFKLLGKLPVQGHIQEILQHYPQGNLALAIAQQQGNLRWHTPFEYELTPSTRPGLNRPKSLDMRNYLRTQACRWRLLLEAFGRDHVAPDWRCGHCDRCRHP